MNNFAILDIRYTPTWFGLLIGTTTNTPCHLTCYYTDQAPRRHKTSRNERGLTLPWGAYFCFVSWHALEQIEAGDTINHTFDFEEWPVCLTRWFTFRGTVAGILSPSVGPIFEYHNLGILPFTFTIGSPAINRIGEFGNVVGLTRFLIESANPSTMTSTIRRANAYFTTASPSKSGYIVTFYETAPGIFSSRDHASVAFPDSVGLHSWHGLSLTIEPGDFIGIGLPEAVGVPDYGIDTQRYGGAGVRHNQEGLTLPIVNKAFRLYPTAIMSLQGEG